MAESVTIARPYAEAVFRLAEDSKNFDAWSRMLQMSATVAQDPQMIHLIADPKMGAADIARVFLGVCGAELDEQGKNFITLLIDNNRVSLLPQVATLYETLKREQAGEVEATIASAVALTETQTSALVSGLEKRFSRKVKASTIVDPQLIGGARITVGDVVIDGSVSGQLQKMAFALKS